MKKLFVFTLFFFLFSNCIIRNKYGVEFLKRQITVGENTYGYRVYLPANRQPGQKLPVMLYLHGSSSCGDDNEAQIALFDKFIGENPGNFSFIVVFPQARAGTFWNTRMIEQAIAALDQTVKEFNGDEKRLYLAGWSMGGLGAWHAAVLYPGKFAALVPVASRIMPSPREREAISDDLICLVDSPKPFEAFAEKLKDVPTWIFHGEKDEVLTVAASRRMNRALIEAGNSDVHYTEYEGMGHYSIESALTEPKLFEWLAKQQLKETHTNAP
jgi:predicted peptidase